jgi:hypothetical protein
MVAVLAAACTNVAAGEAAPTTSESGHSAHTGGGAVPKSVSPATCQSKWVSGGSGSSLNAHPRSGSSTELVAPGPVVMTACRYAGLNQKVPMGTLEASHVVNGSTLSAFVRYVDQKSWQVVKNGAVLGCPFSQGSTDLLEFVYTSGADVMVSVAIGGCPFVSNGNFSVWGGSIGARVGLWVGTDPLPKA